MNWKLFLGAERYTALTEVCHEKHMTISAAVRLAVDGFIKSARRCR